ncbi:DUF3795 domain-containing protein [Caenorhabditis elegans]|uniref:DUF3795 domain-containing protein n=1 Tax=Caenorhabditis elegans TaxID=6239 RepID=N1NV05_CAEEL|nr:DUF3795 domain-containing protein [Caenorhabditis elegans]CCW45963.1 DUF3795 domain-containing protein [Caenorhabditis elegans]|eukprot:NP_001294680.1 Uncharacterized protein CELE_T26H5.9 [Caenorhabditis elegans]
MSDDDPRRFCLRCMGECTDNDCQYHPEVIRINQQREQDFTIRNFNT